MQSRTSTIEAVSSLANPFRSSFEDNELYVLSFGIAKDLLEADDIGRKAVVDSLLVVNLSFTTP